MRARSLRGTLQRLIVLAAVGAVLVVAAAAVVDVRTRAAQREVTSRYFDLVTATGQLHQAMLDQQHDLRGYLLTRADDVAAPRPGQDRVDRLARRIEEDLDGDEALTDRFGRWRRAHRRWTDEVAEPARSLGSTTDADLTALVREDDVRFGEVRRAHQRFESTLLAKREEADRDLRRRSDALFGLLVVLGLLLAPAGLVLWLALRRWVTDPLDQLAREVTEVAEGDLSRRVDVDGPAEIQAVAVEVEKMRERIVSEYARTLESHAIAQEALAVADERAADLERSNRDLEQFAYVASHDLQEPLRKVASFTQMLQRRYAGQLDDRADQYIEFAVDGARRMQQLINDLLTFSRVGRLREPSEQVDLDAALGQALRHLSAAIEESGASISADPLPTVVGERTLLVQLLQNLVGNAIKFRREGTSPEVHLSARRQGPVWELACHDEGIGIDPEYAERIFAIFQRLHARDEYGGTGIGLALCRKIVEHHGGRIWLDTSVASGTTLRWTLPATTTTTSTPTSTPPTSPTTTDPEEPPPWPSTS